MLCPHDPESEAYNVWLDMLDADLDAELEKERRYIEAMALVEMGLWLQKDGKPIRISEMTGSHIRNTIAMIDRNFPRYDDLTAEIALVWRKALEAELSRRYPPIDPALAWG